MPENKDHIDLEDWDLHLAAEAMDEVLGKKLIESRELVAIP